MTLLWSLREKLKFVCQFKLNPWIICFAVFSLENISKKLYDFTMKIVFSFPEKILQKMQEILNAGSIEEKAQKVQEKKGLH